MNCRYSVIAAALALPLFGCDGKDPERLNRVGKKLVEKSHRLADDSNLPKISVTMPEREKVVVEDKKEKADPASLPGQPDERGRAKKNEAGSVK
jgi:hypothetical protein